MADLPECCLQFMNCIINVKSHGLRINGQVFLCILLTELRVMEQKMLTLFDMNFEISWFFVNP